LEQHALSSAFPAMDEGDQQALVDDIEVNGQRDPIVLYEGQVLDGWHRYTACKRLLLPILFTELPNDEDPVAFVKSRNLQRRHLTPSQRAIDVVKCGDWVPVGRPRNSAPGAYFSSAAEMAKEADVSVRTIQQAKAVVSRGEPELVGSVVAGVVSLKKA